MLTIVAHGRHFVNNIYGFVPVWQVCASKNEVFSSCQEKKQVSYLR